MTNIDTATVQRCIEALKGTGEYNRQWQWKNYGTAAMELLETWTYTTHPIDVLQALIKPEKTEAEKLVDEWMAENGIARCDDKRDLINVAQFVLDSVNAEKVAVDFPAEPIDLGVGETPEYIFGPWIEWKGGERPVPGDWEIQTVCPRLRKTLDDPDETLTSAGGWSERQWRDTVSISHYRVRFEVGKWYDWHGGECPLGPDTKVVMKLRDGRDFGPYYVSAVTWQHGYGSGGGDIIRFKVVGGLSVFRMEDK